MSILRVKEDESYKLEPLVVSDWRNNDGKGSDLEAACKIPSTENEFLISESGKWDGKYGRIFHLQINKQDTSYIAEIMGVLDFPEFDAKGPDDETGDEVEGLACQSTNNDKVRIFFGERGGSQAYSSGLIRWAEADLTNYSLAWTNGGKNGC
ncbi:MAG: hypothetical protein U5K71_10465 [Gracilimonas sp.]|nr:hypothetical protein [Gracilimonas sp.]